MKTNTETRRGFFDRCRRALSRKSSTRKIHSPKCVELLESRIAPAFYIVNFGGSPFADSTDSATHGGAGTAGSPFQMSSLRGAVIATNAAAGADTITLPAGTYSLTLTGSDNDALLGDLDINDSLTLTGNTAANTIIQMVAGAAPAGDNKVIGINQDGTHLGLTVAVGNVTITGGKNSFVPTGNFQETGGGVDVFLTGTGNAISFTNTVITGNQTTTSYGGGVNVDSSTAGLAGGTVTFTNTTISNNSALSTGGGVNLFADNHNVVFDGCTISGNTTTGIGGVGSQGGGINIRHTFGGSITIRTGTAISGNTAHGFGGGISVSGGGFQDVTIQDVTIQDSSITGNTVLNNGTLSGEGGGIFHDGVAAHPTTINNTAISGNHADTSGGAGAENPEGGGIHLNTGIVNIGSGTTITGNTSVDGAGIFNRGGTPSNSTTRR